MSTENPGLVVVQDKEVERVPADLLSVIAQAVADPRMDVEKMERLLAMHQQIMDEQRRTAFMAAMARLQAKLPQIEKFGKAKNSKFAKLEDIDVVIRPMLAEEGFSFSFDEESHTEKTMTFIARLSHEKGHFEAKRLTVPIDTASRNREGNAIRPAIQDAGSTVSYARRYLIKMHLNLIEKDEDTDGLMNEPIGEEDVKDLEIMIQDAKADRARFLKYMGVESLGQIMRRDLVKAATALSEKQKAHR